MSYPFTAAPVQSLDEHSLSQHHALGHHENRIKADAETADQADIFLRRLFSFGRQLLQKGGRTAVGNRADIRMHFVFGHADARVADHQHLSIAVGLRFQADLQRRIGVIYGLSLCFQESHFFQSIGGVRNELA